MCLVRAAAPSPENRPFRPRDSPIYVYGNSSQTAGAFRRRGGAAGRAITCRRSAVAAGRGGRWPLGSRDMQAKLWFAAIMALAAGLATAAAQPGGAQYEGELTKDNSFDTARKQSYAKVHRIVMKAGMTYTID